ncbi:MAG: glycosyltransferase 87 family protein [Propionicimonas sp.]|uniref:glycosyltransferase family 87 protein n=1 Tax=Propionicimonas sp. TaxID=1955623 RepID=UPI003D11C235
MTSPVPALSRVLGGPMGRHARPGGTWFSPAPFAFLTLTLSWLIVMIRQVPCRSSSDQYLPWMCYSDIPILYYWRGLKDGLVPFLQTDLEYPVLTGAFMEFCRRLVVFLGGKSEPGLSSEDVTHATNLFFGINAVLLFVLMGVLIWAHLQMSRPWDALMIAASPAILTAGLVNWDALVLAMTALAMLAWSRRKPFWAGFWLGLGIAAKLYPVLLLVPLTVLCFRSNRFKALALTYVGTVASWVAVNLPVYLAAPEGWLNFWTFNADRGGDLGSVWYALSLIGIDIASVSRLEAGLMVAGTVVICALLLLAPRRPRFAQGAFLIVTLFLVVNKVYSPQYVLWLLPLLVLARPRWVDWIAFSIAETAYFAAVWGHLDSQLTNGAGDHRLYVLAIFVRIGVQLWICARVVRDMFDPSRDIVRAGGLDDPDGGVLDEAPDATWVTRLTRGPVSS